MLRQSTRQTGLRSAPAACGAPALGLLLFLGLPLLAHSVEATVPYRTSLEGVTDAALRGLLESVSDCLTLQKKPPASLGLLRRRVERDVATLGQALRSRAYLDARVSSRIDEAAAPVQVRFLVEPGRRYELRRLTIGLAAGTTTTAPLPTPQALGLRPGEPAESPAILAAKDRLVEWLGQRGFPLARVLALEATAHVDSGTADLHLAVRPGPPARFGPLVVRGLKTVRRGHVHSQVPWRPGARFDARLLSEFQRRLTTSRVFASARITPATSVAADGTLPVHVLVAERKHRLIELGASYKTDVGAGVRLAWENRNFRERGELLSAQTAVTGIGSQFSTSYRRPGFLRSDQTLLVDLGVADDTPDAYHSRNAGFSVGLERMLAPRRAVRAGLTSRFSEVTQAGRRDSFQMLLFPVQFEDDGTDDLLDPTHGHRLELRLTPAVDPFGDSVEFVKSVARHSSYWRMGRTERLVLATRETLGSLAGAARLALPADERFYAGGGASVRGYAYQSVGPDDGRQTLGGRSLAEVSLELRLRPREGLGFVGFLDGGGSFESEIPDFSGRFLWGAGVGLRYQTPVGPIRIDVAVPLNKRDGLDAEYQLYFGVGQAF